jgi:hypothetical protein
MASRFGAQGGAAATLPTWISESFLCVNFAPPPGCSRMYRSQPWRPLTPLTSPLR